MLSTSTELQFIMIRIEWFFFALLDRATFKYFMAAQPQARPKKVTKKNHLNYSRI